MQTIDQKLQLYKGIGPGFDFLRIGLAVSIVAYHSSTMLGYFGFRNTPIWLVAHALVPMFFALSGFLVTGSAMRLSLKNFLLNRSLRILPSLVVDIFICALVVGPLMTNVPLTEYFAAADFFDYFWNVTGWIHYTLPGVFKDNPIHQVNGALWTVPFEMLCYVMMSLLILSHWVRKPTGVAICVILIMATSGVFEHFHIEGKYNEVMSVSNPIATLSFIFATPGTSLLITFLLGVFTFQLKHVIPYSWYLFILCCMICLAAAVGHDRTWVTQILSKDFVLLPLIVYITCFLGVTAIPVPKFVHSGDYSYGIYLYHSPFLQILVAVFPGLAGHRAIGIPVVFLLGMAVVMIIAACSWHFVEKPVLGLRKRFSFVARVRGVAGHIDVGVAPPLQAKSEPT